MMYALDTNIVSYLLKQNETVIARFRQANDNGDECVIPPIVYYEIKRGLLAVGAVNKAALFDDLCEQFGVGEMSTAAWDEAARVYAEHRKKGQPIEDADLFIAAFCLMNHYTLVSHNVKHFQIIEGLEVVDWAE